MAGLDPEQVIRFLKDNGFMGKPEDSPWPRFDPETMERKPFDLHRFMTDDKYLEEVIGISFDLSDAFLVEIDKEVENHD